jgi:hypothetical protein
MIIIYVNIYKMGNTLYADTLIGMTLKTAKKFITDNYVYFIDTTGTKYKITIIREIVLNGIYTKDDCPNRLNVETENDVIITILGNG